MRFLMARCHLVNNEPFLEKALGQTWALIFSLGTVSILMIRAIRPLVTSSYGERNKRFSKSNELQQATDARFDKHSAFL